MNAAELSRVAERGDRLYFAGLSLVILLLILWAFAPSYFLREMYHRPAPPPFIVVHGALMTGWVLLLAGQALLVSLGRMSWHGKLGNAGIIYAAFLVPIGCIAVTISAAREVHGHTKFMLPELNVFGISLVQMLLFGGWVGAAFAFRSRPDYHKRMIALATLSVLPNAVVRLSFNIPAFSFVQTNLDILNMWAVLLLAAIAIDAARTRRLHPVFALGGSLTAFALYTVWFVSRTAMWDRFWIQSFT
ncbi:MAG TPA: hypothetical protein VG843_10715 [Rhizomicrobium sp.]|jgi:hypothetical protein|nr:hypothetical protein [Rhizomicrobium sp.]